MVDVPAPGNVLGLSFVVQGEVAVLRLDERVLGPGLALRDYEAELADFERGVDPGLPLAAFQQRRCRVRRLTLELDPDRWIATLQSRWVGRTLAGVHVERVAFDPATPVGPLLRVSGRWADGGWRSDLWPVELRADGDDLELHPRAHWVFGAGPDLDELWRALLHASGCVGGSPEALRLDPPQHAVTGAFVAAGWKAPDLSRLDLVDLVLQPGMCRVRYEGDAAGRPWNALRAPEPAPAWVARLRALRQALAEPGADLERASAWFDELAEACAEVPLARAAALAWWVDRIRHAGATVPGAVDRALAAIQRWRRCDPDDPLARRWQIELLARARRYHDLVRILGRPWERPVDEDQERARDLALAHLYGSKLGQRQAGLERLDRWAPDTRHPAVQLALARLEAGVPARALARLQATLPALDDAETRFAERLAVAWAMTQAQQFEAANEQLATLLADGTQDPANRSELRALARRLGEHATALRLLQDELATEPLAVPPAADPRATELALLGCAAEHPCARDWLRNAMDRDPDDAELLRWAARLHERAGDTTAAIAALERLETVSPSTAETRSRLARLLVQRGQAHADAGAFEAAEADGSRAIALLPEGAQAATRPALFLCDRALDRGDAPAALRWLTPVLERPEVPAEAGSRLARLARLDPSLELGRWKSAVAIEATGDDERVLAALEAVLAVDPTDDDAVAQLLPRYAAQQRWRDSLAVLERRFLRQQGRDRSVTLREMARIHREALLDLPLAEQTVRRALDHLGDPPIDRDLAEALRAELVADVQRQGRFVDLSIDLARALAPEIEGRVPREALHPTRARLLVELARIYRGPLDDEAKAARIYERLEHYGLLPEDGLATLARAFRRAGRHPDLVRLLEVRAKALASQGEHARKAAVDVRIAELLDGPLGRPHEAADHYLDAYLTDPVAHAAAGARARVLFSGVDAIANVRRKLLTRLEQLPVAQRPTLLTLLGDVLALHEEHEGEAESHYRAALEIDPDDAVASESLGRLLARQGRLEAAVGPLAAAASHPALEPGRAAEAAAIAARALLELAQPDEAEAILKVALQRAPDSQRALLELARLYERMGRASEQAIVLEDLSELPLSSMLSAEVAYRRAVLLLPAAQTDPFCPEAERARAYLLEAVSADAKHVAARQGLRELAAARLEWSVVAHMHYLAIRELPSGPERAAVHLDLADTYLDRLQDTESATRNIESAIQQAPGDRVVASRAGALAARLPEPCKVAQRFERIAATTTTLDASARARLWLVAADLYLTQDDPAAAEAASQAVLALPGVPPESAAVATRNLELLAFDEARDLRQQKTGLLRLLEAEEHPIERMHILRRLREIGAAMDDPNLVEWSCRELIALALDEDDLDGELGAATAALRELCEPRGDHAEVVRLYRQLAARLRTPLGQARAWLEAARATWQGLRDARAAVGLLQESLARVPAWAPALQMLGELTRAQDDPRMQSTVYRTLMELDPRQRPLELELELGRLARSLGRTNEALALLRPLTVQTHAGDIRLAALRELDALLAATSAPAERLPVLRRYLDECHERGSDAAGDVAFELATHERELGQLESALQSVHKGLTRAADHRGLLELHVRLLEATERWDALARALERLAPHVPDADEQGQIYVRAARVRLEATHGRTDPQVRRLALAEARRLLERAADAAPDAVAAKLELLPVAFAEHRWDEVLALALELRRAGHDDADVLLLASLTEAFHHGQRALASDIGHRHGAQAERRFLFPGLRQLLTEIALHGPLPRLDALLSAAATLAGGRASLAAGLRRWASGHPLQLGLALGLARLAEAEGQGDIARPLYQVAGFMAPDGPVAALAQRLPLALPPRDPAALRREVLDISGLLPEAVAPAVAVPPTPAERWSSPPEPHLERRWELVDALLEPWRRAFGRPLPLRWSEVILPGGVGLDPADGGAVSLSAGVDACSVPELRYRLAYAIAGLVVGHLPTSPPDAVAPPERLDANLERLDRARMLWACRVSGQLDGALLGLAHDKGLVQAGRPDPRATLRHADALWLLRALRVS